MDKKKDDKTTNPINNHEIKNSLNQLNHIANQKASSFSLLRASLLKFSNQLKIIPNIFNEAFTKNFDKIQHLLDKFPDDIQKIIRVCVDNEWIPTDNIQIYEYNTIMTSINTGKKSDQEIKNDIDAFFIKIIDENYIKCLFSNLHENETLSNRIMMIEEIEFAFKNNKYYLANPLMIAVIEGIIIDNIDKIEYAGWRKIAKHIEYNSDHYDLITLHKIIIEKFYARFTPGVDKKIPNGICRHAIMHGADIQHGNKLTSLKLLLILEAVTHLKTIYKKSENK